MISNGFRFHQLVALVQDLSPEVVGGEVVGYEAPDIADIADTDIADTE